MESAASLQKLNLDMTSLIEEEARQNHYRRNLKNQLKR